MATPLTSGELITKLGCIHTKPCMHSLYAVRKKLFEKRKKRASESDAQCQAELDSDSCHTP